MIGARNQFILLGAAVVALGVILGTVLWVKLAPRSGAIVRGGEERLKQYGTVPDFKLTERSGKDIRLADLRGKIWIADLIYTTCTDTCPLQTAAMARLQQEFAAHGQFQLVSITVDPERDTPQILTAYAAKHEADAARWLFLTGQRAQVIGLIRDGFHLSVATLPDSAQSSGMIPHSSRFILIDGETQIRGYYDSREMEAFLRLKNDLTSLLKG